MKFESAQVVLASAGGFLENLDPKWRGLVALSAALLIGWGAGVTMADRLARFESLEPRVTELEQWQEVHVDSVSGPGMARIERLEGQTSTLRSDVSLIREMITQMYCEEVFPERCPRELPR